MGYYENLEKEGWFICPKCGEFKPPMHLVEKKRFGRSRYNCQLN